MVSIGRHTDYASRIVLHLAALEPGARVTAAQIAERRLIPPVFIRRIVSRLSQAGILTTTRGARGGITLARPPSEVSLKDVVTAMEGPVVLNACVVDAKSCPLSDDCPVRGAWGRINGGLSELLENVRFDELAGKVGGECDDHGGRRGGRAKAGRPGKGGTKRAARG